MHFKSEIKQVFVSAEDLLQWLQKFEIRALQCYCTDCKSRLDAFKSIRNSIDAAGDDGLAVYHLQPDETLARRE